MVRSPFLAVVLVAFACGGPSSDVPASGTGTVSSTGALETTAAASECVDVHEGDLDLDASSDLESLRTLRQVTGRLRIHGVETEDLGFLECLESVGGVLSIRYNPSLRSLQGLERLESVGLAVGYVGLSVTDNPALESLSGLDSLRWVPTLTIHGNASLSHLGLDHLEGVLDGFYIGGCSQDGEGAPAVMSGNNPSLTVLDGLSALEDVGALIVSGQESLTSLEPLRLRAQAGAEFGDIQFKGNPTLTIDEIEALLDAAGVTLDEDVCGNAGGPTECSCWTEGE